MPSAVLVVPPLDEMHCARYDVIAAPPLSAGAVNRTFAVLFDVAVAVTFVGLPGATAGSVTVDEYGE